MPDPAASVHMQCLTSSEVSLRDKCGHCWRINCGNNVCHSVGFSDRAGGGSCGRGMAFPRMAASERRPTADCCFAKHLYSSLRNGKMHSLYPLDAVQASSARYSASQGDADPSAIVLCRSADNIEMARLTGAQQRALDGQQMDGATDL